MHESPLADRAITASCAVRSALTAADGTALALWHWAADSTIPRRGIVVVVHGIGEHARRHDRLAQHLTHWGFAVLAHDHRGHGESPGPRGVLPAEMQLVDDLDEVVAHARRQLASGERLILLGHSMGGLVAAVHVLQRRSPVDALVLSSPALRADLSAFQRLLLAVLPRLAPNLAVSRDQDPQWLSHDPRVVQAYREDPLVHDRISGRLARFIIDWGPKVIAGAPAWPVPTLLMWGGSDRIVNPHGSRDFAAAAPLARVTARGFEDLRHEIFNERDALPVYAALRDWLAQRA